MGMIKSISGTSVAPSNGAASQDISGYWQTVMSERIAESMQPRGNVEDAAPESGVDAGQDEDEDDSD
jgi:hypothetical protein